MLECFDRFPEILLATSDCNELSSVASGGFFVNGWIATLVTTILPSTLPFSTGTKAFVISHLSATLSATDSNSIFTVVTKVPMGLWLPLSSQSKTDTLMSLSRSNSHSKASPTQAGFHFGSNESGTCSDLYTVCQIAVPAGPLLRDSSWYIGSEKV